MLPDVGTTINLAYEGNPIKAQGGKELFPRLAQMMDGWRKEDTPTNKKLLVGVDILNFLAKSEWYKVATELVKIGGRLDSDRILIFTESERIHNKGEEK